MRFLHTSDWHVGRTIRGRSRDTEHEAALQELLTYARENQVDCLLVAGDVFDTSAPSAESEKLVYEFFRELHGAGIPAIVIAGNHDHPRRFDAIAPLLRTVRIHLLGEPREAGEGGIVEVASRDGKERALVAALPWLTERRVVEFAQLSREQGAALSEYAEQVPKVMETLCEAFQPDAVSILLSHVLVNEAVVGTGGGERPLHLSMGIYGVQRQRFPASAQYVALGHVHKAQELMKSPAAWYSGSLLQLDFGEAEQDKWANLVEVHPKQPASVAKLPIGKGTRRLIDVGTPARGVSLDELGAYADKVGDAWLRVFIDLDMPVANLPAMVRERLPNAVHVEPVQTGATVSARVANADLRPEELFAAFYKSSLGRGRDPSPPTVGLFRQLLDEESHAAADP